MQLGHTPLEWQRFARANGNKSYAIQTLGCAMPLGEFLRCVKFVRSSPHNRIWPRSLMTMNPSTRTQMLSEIWNGIEERINARGKLRMHYRDYDMFMSPAGREARRRRHPLTWKRVQEILATNV